jgi:hypothetical protein
MVGVSGVGTLRPTSRDPRRSELSLAMACAKAWRALSMVGVSGVGTLRPTSRDPRRSELSLAMACARAWRAFEHGRGVRRRYTLPGVTRPRTDPRKAGVGARDGVRQDVEGVRRGEVSGVDTLRPTSRDPRRSELSLAMACA